MVDEIVRIAVPFIMFAGTIAAAYTMKVATEKRVRLKDRLTNIAVAGVNLVGVVSLAVNMKIM